MGRILLCDDEESLCRSLGRILRAAGHEVVTQNGEQGLARLRQERFDLILTDIRMPDVSGFDIVAAARLHAPSGRKNKPFVAVNCAAIPSNLVESELFGHAKGSFTGASSARTGRFAQADTGTIFLDEIGEMEIGVQAKLLRLIQDGELYPGGEETPTKVDVR